MNKHVRILSSGEELSRRSALYRYDILNSPPESAFDDLTIFASQLFKLPISIISFTGEDDVFYKANFGFGDRDCEQLEGSICGQIINPEAVLVFENIEGHKDFLYNLHDIKFFAAAPIVTPDGHSIGNFVVMGNESISFDDENQNLLRKLAKMTMDLLQSRIAISTNKKLAEENSSLRESNKKTNEQNNLLSNYQEEVAKANSVLEGVLDSYELLFKFAPVAIGICSFKDKVIWQANDALLNIFGEEETLLGSKLGSIIKKINGTPSKEILNLMHQDHHSYHTKDAKLEIKHAQGKKNIFVNLSLQFVGRMGDEAQNIMFILADVTEQVILKQIVREANSVLMNAIEDTGMGYTIVEFETGNITSNTQFKANYGFSVDEEFSYPDVFNAMLPEYRKVIKEAVSDAILKKGIYQAEYEVKWRDGSIHKIRAYGKPMYDADGKATHIIGLNKVISNS